MNYKGRKKKNLKSSFLAISVVVFGLLIYLGISTGFVDSVIQKVLAPFSQDVLNTGSQNDQEDKKEYGIEIGGFDSYAMQVGAFSDQSNAQALSDDIITQGGAGYLIYDEMYRVMAFSYDSEDEANQVKTQLKETSGVEASVYTISVPKVDLKILSSEDNYEKINNAFNSFVEVKNQLHQIIVAFDKGESDYNTVVEQVSSLRETLGASQKDIETIASEDDKLMGFNDILNKALEGFDNLSESDETIYSAKLKSLYIDIVYNYDQYIRNLNDE